MCVFAQINRCRWCKLWTSEEAGAVNQHDKDDTGDLLALSDWQIIVKSGTIDTRPAHNGLMLEATESFSIVQHIIREIKAFS